MVAKVAQKRCICGKLVESGVYCSKNCDRLVRDILKVANLRKNGGGNHATH
jgi:hypothetical protein